MRPSRSPPSCIRNKARPLSFSLIQLLCFERGAKSAVRRRGGGRLEALLIIFQFWKVCHLTGAILGARFTLWNALSANVWWIPILAERHQAGIWSLGAPAAASKVKLAKCSASGSWPAGHVANCPSAISEAAAAIVSVSLHRDRSQAPIK